MRTLTSFLMGIVLFCSCAQINDDDSMDIKGVLS